MCEYASLILLEESMSEFASVIATTEGPLHLYASPGIDSHGDARAGWGIKGGAEVEWTGEQHDSLTVRYEDAAMARTIRAMLVERFPTRSKMLKSITETRGPGGIVQLYRAGKICIPDDAIVLRYLRLPPGYTEKLPAGLKQTGDLRLPDGYTEKLPAGLKQTGYLYLPPGYTEKLPAGLRRR